jgi:hypothetical protein
MEETATGCENRLQSLKSQISSNWDFVVSIENGLFHASIKSPEETRLPKWNTNPEAIKFQDLFEGTISPSKGLFHDVYYDDCYIIVEHISGKRVVLPFHPQNDSAVEISKGIYHFLKNNRDRKTPLFTGKATIGDYYCQFHMEKWGYCSDMLSERFYPFSKIWEKHGEFIGKLERNDWHWIFHVEGKTRGILIMEKIMQIRNHFVPLTGC